MPTERQSTVCPATATATTSPEKCLIFNKAVTGDDLRKIFSSLGMVGGVEIVRTKGRSFAYVDFVPSIFISLSKLFSTYNGCVWKGGRLKLEKAKEHYLTRLKKEWEENVPLATNPSMDVDGADKTTDDF